MFSFVLYEYISFNVYMHRKEHISIFITSFFFFSSLADFILVYWFGVEYVWTHRTVILKSLTLEFFLFPDPRSNTCPSICYTQFGLWSHNVVYSVHARAHFFKKLINVFTYTLYVTESAESRDTIGSNSLRSVLYVPIHTI